MSFKSRGNMKDIDDLIRAIEIIEATEPIEYLTILSL
jgi:hypothetical protein